MESGPFCGAQSAEIAKKNSPKMDEAEKRNSFV